MEQILQAFGIDARLIIIQMINFAVLAWLLWYFLYTPVLKIIRERQRKIEEGVLNAEAAERELASANEKKQEILSEAHRDAEELAARAKESADGKAVEIVEEAHKRAHEISLDAEAKSEALKQQAISQSEAEIAKLAVLAAERILREKQ